MSGIPDIILRKLVHRGEARIAALFAYHPILQRAVKQIPGVRWSQTHQCWHIPFTRNAYELLLSHTSGIAQVDDKGLRLKHEANVSLPLTRPGPAKQHRKINDANTAALAEMAAQLQLKAYSVSTIRTYTNEMTALLQLLGNKNVNELDTTEVKRYLLYCINELKLKENTIHSRVNALKFYFEQVLGREKFFVSIPRPKRPMQLPKLLNEDEIRRLFNALTNKKHKAMLFTAYSAGLRVSEIAALKLNQIDSKRMQIYIERAKGKKDRYVNLSPVLLDILRKYISEYTPRPRVYLFESEQTFTAYPTRTIQQIFAKAKHKAHITKDVGVHSLRHSFATHLLDKGTDIKYIKDLLGHFDIRTTERYLHVSNQRLVNVISPFDDLMSEGGVEW